MNGWGGVRYVAAGTAHSAVTFWTLFSTTLPATMDWVDDCERTLKPGGHLVVVTTPKDYHRVAAGVEDGGFEIRDQIVWLRDDFTTNTSVVLARKPLEGTVVANVLKYGTGAVHIDANRLGVGEPLAVPQSNPEKRVGVVWNAGFGDAPIDVFQQAQRESIERTNTLGRWPTNTVLSHSTGCIPMGMVEEEIPINVYEDRGPFGDSQVDKEYEQRVSTTKVMSWACVEGCITLNFPTSKSAQGTPRAGVSGSGWGMTATGAEYDDDGSSARFFTTASNWDEFYGYLVNLVTPPDGNVFDPLGHHHIRGVVTDLGFHYVDGKNKWA